MHRKTAGSAGQSHPAGARPGRGRERTTWEGQTGPGTEKTGRFYRPCRPSRDEDGVVEHGAEPIGAKNPYEPDAPARKGRSPRWRVGLTSCTAAAGPGKRW